MRSLHASARRFSIVLVCLLATIICARADIRFDKNYIGLQIAITGTITASDAKALEDMQEELQRNIVEVHLDSLGGD
jgi:hypothetical protein